MKKTKENTTFLEELVKLHFHKWYILLLVASQFGIWVPTLLAKSSIRHPVPHFEVFNFTLTIVIVFITYLFLLKHIKSNLLFIVLILNAILLLTGDFSSIYWGIGTRHNWSIPLSHLDSVYVAVGTLTTAGVDGISPVSETARSYLLLQNIIDFSLFTLLISLVIARFSKIKS